MPSSFTLSSEEHKNCTSESDLPGPYEGILLISLLV